MFKPCCSVLLLCVVLTLSMSCATGRQNGSNAFENSKIYPRVACTADTNQSYALLLPPQYESGKPCPVLILFDSHGDGLLPVNLFSTQAAINGFIIAGSNSSKNGLPADQTTAIYRTLLNDLTERFSIEKKAIYLCGFSGGSRMAGAAAITEGGVAGVVGCGAGLPNIKQKPVDPFSYLAVAGNQDFNLTEMQQLDLSLDQAGYIHHLLVFNGIHQWPTKELIPDIFTWIRFDAMRQKAIPDDRTEINSFIEKNDKMASEFAASNNHVKQQETYLKMMHYLQGLTDVTPLQSEIDRLAMEKDVVTNLEHQKQLMTMEQDLQRKYAPEVEKQSIEWWTKEAGNLHSLSLITSNSDESAVYKRVLGFLSLNCYMYSTGALKQDEPAAASKFIAIYGLVDPTNSEAPYLAAKVAAINHDADAMFRSLELAVSLGFNDIKRLETDADFTAYRQDARFTRLVAKK